ncbi:MAG: hypothetical protein GY953_22835 [bacterium]|nr:hypothetical protein [bacterium]
MPALVTVPVGLTEANFFVTANNLPLDQTATIRATFFGSTASANVVIEAASGAMLDSLSLTPAVVVGGTPVTGVVSLTRPAPAGGIRVTLRSSSPLFAPAPAPLTIPAGFQSQQFVIQTRAVVFTIDVTITATAIGVSRTATLRLNP